jgi:hypothetical protein
MKVMLTIWVGDFQGHSLWQDRRGNYIYAHGEATVYDLGAVVR